MRGLRELVVEEEGMCVQGVDVDDEECRATVSNWAQLGSGVRVERLRKRVAKIYQGGGGEDRK